MNYRTTFKRCAWDKHLNKPKKILFKSLEQLREHYSVLETEDKEDIKVFKDEDEMYMHLNGVDVKYIPYNRIGKPYDIEVIGEVIIKILKSEYGYEEYPLWVIDKVLNPKDNPEFYI